MLLFTPHSRLHTLHYKLYTLHTLHFTLHTPHSTLYTLHSTLHTLHSSLHTLHSTLYTPHFTLYTLHSPLHTLHSTLYTLHCALHALHSTFFRAPQSTVHWYGNRGKNVDCSNNLYHKSVLRGCIRVRGLHLVIFNPYNDRLHTPIFHLPGPWTTPGRHAAQVRGLGIFIANDRDMVILMIVNKIKMYNKPDV